MGIDEEKHWLEDYMGERRAFKARADGLNYSFSSINSPY